jgi:hypothetical protein
MQKELEYYILGLFQTDGHLRSSSRNRGSLSIELKYEDLEILERIASEIRFNYKIGDRTRTTNYKNDYHSCYLVIYDKEFRDWVNKRGVPYGKKSNEIKPICDIEDKYVFDYVRGLIDGDGSLGITSKNRSFINLTTESEFINDFWVNFIETHSERVIQRNNPTARDNIYQVTAYDEAAQELVKKIYYGNCFGLKRKIEKALAVKKWKRSEDVKKIDFKRYAWNERDDEILMSNSLEEALKIMPYRTLKSLKIRRWRLAKKRVDKLS